MTYYAVKEGREPGIYDSWDLCQKQVLGYKGAIYKKFPTRDQALAFIREEEEEELSSIGELSDQEMVCYVDGSYNPKEEVFGYGVVSFTKEGKQSFFGSFHGDYAKYRNVAGEVFAAVKSMELCIKEKKSKLTIYHDYTGLRHWALGEWKTNTPLTENYKNYAKEIQEKVQLSFVKVAAHMGDPYNEEADQLAKKGAGL